MMEYIKPRYNTGAFNLPGSDKMEAFVSTLLNKYKLVVTVGITGTGKSTFLSHFKPMPGWSYTLWERDAIFDLMFNDGRRPDEFYGAVDKFEGDILPKLTLEPYHRILISGWNRMPQSRRRYLSYMPKGLGQTCCLVFDGPIDSIVARNRATGVAGKFNRIEEDLELYLRQQHSTIVWPTREEGYTDVIYINTFGDEGADYLSDRLV